MHVSYMATSDAIFASDDTLKSKYFARNCTADTNEKQIVEKLRHYKSIEPDGNVLSTVQRSCINNTRNYAKDICELMS